MFFHSIIRAPRFSRASSFLDSLDSLEPLDLLELLVSLAGRGYSPSIIT